MKGIGELLMLLRSVIKDLRVSLMGDGWRVELRRTFFNMPAATCSKRNEESWTLQQSRILLTYIGRLDVASMGMFGD